MIKQKDSSTQKVLYIQGKKWEIVPSQKTMKSVNRTAQFSLNRNG
jgi:hypothetical protein